MRRSPAEKTTALKRAASRQWVLKPQDLAVAFKLVALRGQWLPYQSLAAVLRLSPFEVHAAVQRLIAARLVVELEGPPQPNLAALRSFVLHGASYAYPPVRTEVTIGFPTAHAVAPLKEKFGSPGTELPIVWPHPQGSARGHGLLPLYPNLPLAALEDSAFYEFLALFDALRAGQARERELAAKLLQERLSG